MIINNLPANFKNYPFIVVRKVDGKFWFWGAYRNRNRANEDAMEINGITIETASL